MKDKLKFLTRQSLNKKIKTKWFKAVNVLLLILLIVITNIDRIVSFFGGDFENITTIQVIDEIDIYEPYKETLNTILESLNKKEEYQIEKTTKDIEELKNELNEKNNQIIIRILKDDENYIKAEIISYDDIGLTDKQLLNTSLNNIKEMLAFTNSGLTQTQIKSLTTPIEIASITTNPNIKNGENKELIASGVIILLILPCFFLILMLVQMIGAEVNDEKTTRSMEIIISNVSPKTHFLSKIFASTSFVIIQGALLVFYALIALALRGIFTGGISTNGEIAGSVNKIFMMVKETGILNTLLQGLPFILILFVLSFIAYAILAGVLASMTTSTEDFQQLQTPIMLIIMVGYYLAIMASQFEGALFIKIVSYIPMLSFMLSPGLFILGQITMIELIISTIITGVFTYFLFKYGLRIYKVGILNYSSNGLWKKMFHSLKKKKTK